MTTREALKEVNAALVAQGRRLTIWELRGMLERNEITRPRVNSALQFDWGSQDIARLKEALAEKEETPA